LPTATRLSPRRFVRNQGQFGGIAGRTVIECETRNADSGSEPQRLPAGLLIHHARPLSRRAEKAELPDLPGPHSPTEHSLLEIDDVLNRLAAINPALRRVVELRVFEGLTREEIAWEMGCGTATVARHWGFTRNWLEEAFAGTAGL
jgi:hypothetical protein